MAENLCLQNHLNESKIFNEAYFLLFENIILLFVFVYLNFKHPTKHYKSAVLQKLYLLWEITIIVIKIYLSN